MRTFSLHDTRNRTALNQLLFSTLRITTDIGNVGTGTLMKHQWQGRTGTFLVTNRHVVKGASGGTLTFTRADAKGLPLFSEKLELRLHGNAWAWTGHPDENVDVAALPLAGGLDQLREDGTRLFYVRIDADIILEDEPDEIDAVEEVLFLGYPSGLYDPAHNLPIVRKGISATPLTMDYDNKPIFLIDASVFPGSSGSPVFLHQFFRPEFGQDGDARWVFGHRRGFLGIVSSSYHREEAGILRLEEVPAELRPVVKIRQMIDIGVVFKARTVLEKIEFLVNRPSGHPTL